MEKENDNILQLNRDCNVSNFTELQNYIENNVFPQYELNGKSHGVNHIKEVISRAMKIAKGYDVNYNILYTAAAYHDIGDHINREHHEIVSAKIMYEDKNLEKFFEKSQIETIKEAIEDHRASLKTEPRNIYGKILSSADKNTEIDKYFERAIQFGLERYNDLTEEEQLDKVYEHAIKKFGKDGYATKNIYIPNNDYEEYLKKLQKLIYNKDEFYKKARTIYKKINL